MFKYFLFKYSLLISSCYALSILSLSAGNTHQWAPVVEPLLHSPSTSIAVARAAKPNYKTVRKTLGNPEKTGIPQRNAALKKTQVEAVCEKSPAPIIVRYGYNKLIDAQGNEVPPQGRPTQVGYQLLVLSQYVPEHNNREMARIFAIMSPIREALMCDVTNVSEAKWAELTKVLTLNNIKVTQQLSGTPREQYYSSAGIFAYLRLQGPDYHPMMKYLEEAELELKCLAFKDFDFINPVGDNHCTIHNIAEGSGIKLP